MLPSSAEKIKDLSQLGTLAQELKNQGKRIVHCHGVFDLLHPGHVRHFTQAKKKGDVLVVTVTADQYVNKGPGRPIFNEQLRAEVVASLAAVDYVAINRAPTAVSAIEIIHPDVYVKGNEYTKERALSSGGMDKESEAVAATGGTVEFTDDITFSSTKLINNFLSPYSQAAQEFLRQFQTRFAFEDISAYFEKIKNYKVLIIGETIIDEYHYVKAMHKSPKENIIATRYENEETFAGGVLACANHIAGYCKSVDVVTALGAKDSKEDLVRGKLKSNVQAKFFYHPTAPTIVKRRFVEPTFLTKMFEVYHFNDEPTPTAMEEDMLSYLNEALPKYDLVIVVDYGHGLLTPRLRECIASRAPFLAVNTQTNSANYGFHVITKYPRADFACIDHFEARLVARQKDVASIEQWKTIIKGIAEGVRAHNTVITLGHEGCLSYDNNELHRIPVLSTNVLDRVGAGDAFLAITAPLAKAGMPAEALGFVGNAVGAIAVKIVGNRESVEPIPLLKSISTMLKS